MMAVMLRAVVLVSLLAAGCLSPGPYVCATAEDCGAGGSCAPVADGSSYCAVADGECPSGQRFGESAGAQAGQCTGAPRLGGDECFAGGPLDPARSTCVADVCADQPWCCGSSWGPLCVQAAEVRCAAACGGRVAFTRERLTNGDHSQILQDGSVEVYDLAPGGPGGTLVATPVPTGIAGPQAYWSAAWVDVDRDRAPELFVGTHDGYVNGDHQRLWQPASPSWQLMVDLRAIGLPANVIDIGFGDTNRDGLVDLVVPSGGSLAVFTGVDTGDHFVPGTPAIPDPPEGSPLASGLDLGDLGGDGDDDVVYLDYRNELGRTVARDEGFVHGPTFVTASVTGDVSFGDVDDDGDLDILVADGAGAMLMRNDGGALPPVWNYPTGPRKGSYFSTATWIDVDGDHDLDVVVGSNETGRLTLIENVGGVLLDSVLWVSPIELAGEITRVAAGDVDGDGDLDLAVAGGDDAPSRIWLNDGDRTFTPGWVDGAFRRHQGVALTARPMR